MRDSAPGCNGITGTLLLKLAPVLVHPITIIFQQSILGGKFPSSLKHAIIQLLFKRKGEKMDPKSCRPISLCSTLGKVLERVVKDQLEDYLANAGCFSRIQLGFIKNRSTISNLLTTNAIIEEWG